MSNKFDVKVMMDHGDIFLSVIHNGDDWTSIRIDNPNKEIPRIIEALLDYVKNRIIESMKTKRSMEDKEVKNKEKPWRQGIEEEGFK